MRQVYISLLVHENADDSVNLAFHGLAQIRLIIRNVSLIIGLQVHWVAMELGVKWAYVASCEKANKAFPVSFLLNLETKKTDNA